jgi:hypothetical protein
MVQGIEHPARNFADADGAQIRPRNEIAGAGEVEQFARRKKADHRRHDGHPVEQFGQVEGPADHIARAQANRRDQYADQT